MPFLWKRVGQQSIELRNHIKRGEKICLFAGTLALCGICFHCSYIHNFNISYKVQNTVLLLYCLPVGIKAKFHDLYRSNLILDDEMKDELAGSTANVVLVKNNKLYCVSIRNWNHICVCFIYFPRLYLNTSHCSDCTFHCFHWYGVGWDSMRTLTLFYPLNY